VEARPSPVVGIRHQGGRRPPTAAHLVDVCVNLRRRSGGPSRRPRALQNRCPDGGSPESARQPRMQHGAPVVQDRGRVAAEAVEGEQICIDVVGQLLERRPDLARPAEHRAEPVLVLVPRDGNEQARWCSSVAAVNATAAMARSMSSPMFTGRSSSAHRRRRTRPPPAAATTPSTAGYPQCPTAPPVT
jgi:hypothetical protein